MMDCITTVETLTLAAKLISLSAAVNIICWIALIWGVFRFRKAVREWKGAVR